MLQQSVQLLKLFFPYCNYFLLKTKLSINKKFLAVTIYNTHVRKETEYLLYMSRYFNINCITITNKKSKCCLNTTAYDDFTEKAAFKQFK